MTKFLQHTSHTLEFIQPYKAVKYPIHALTLYDVITQSVQNSHGAESRLMSTVSFGGQ